MTWFRRLFPFVATALDARRASRRELEQQIRFLEQQVSDAKDQERYWRTRAEKLMDAALARAGAIHEPTMREPVIPQVDKFAAVMGAMAVTEIDGKGRAS